MLTFSHFSLIGFLLLSFNTLAAEKQKISRNNLPLVNQQMKTISSLKSLSRTNKMEDMVALGLKGIRGINKNDSFKVKRSLMNSKKHQNIRYQQYYQDMPVWGYQINAQLKSSNIISKLHGKAVTNISDDLSLSQNKPLLIEADILKKIKLLHTDKSIQFNHSADFSQESIQKIIYIDDNSFAHVAYLINFFIQNTDRKSVV